MTDAWFLTCAPLFGMMSNVLVQAALSHIWRRRNTGTAIKAGAAVGLAVAAGAAASARDFPALEGISWSVLSYIGLAFGYWAFLNLNLTSLRIRVLKEIASAREGALSHATLVQRYAGREIVQRRLARLEAAGQVTRRGERYVLRTRTLVRIARIIRLVRKIIIPSS